MDNRLKTLFSLAGEGETFCDIGCDHGFVSLEALKSGKFKRVIISDISKKSLSKAEKLLSPYGDKVSSFVADGFSGINEEISVGFIAGMGGEEITNILLNAKRLPPKLVLSPQGRSEKVRKTLLSLGYDIKRDFTLFSAGKYYDAIMATKSEIKLEYSNLELKYGKENLTVKPKDFIAKLNKDLEFKSSLLLRELNEKDKKEVLLEIEEIKGILNENT